MFCYVPDSSNQNNCILNQNNLKLYFPSVKITFCVFIIQETDQLEPSECDCLSGQLPFLSAKIKQFLMLEPQNWSNLHCNITLPK